MPAKALKCKECDERYPLDARFVCDRCFGPLEVLYDLSDLDPAETRRRIQAGPPSIWRYADFLPFDRPPRTALAAGVTPLRSEEHTSELQSRSDLVCRLLLEKKKKMYKKIKRACQL